MDAQALLRAVIDYPADDLRRLVYADWCEEAGDAARAEFVRVQVALARVDPRPWHEECDDTSPCPCHRLRKRERELFAGYTRWIGEPFAQQMPCAGLAFQTQEAATPEGYVGGVISRGFVSAVRLPQDAWLEHGPAVILAHPVERVELSDKEPHGQGGRFVWFRELPGVGARWSLDLGLFKAMLDLGCRFDHDWMGVSFDSAEEAEDALSAAGLLFARQAGARPRRRRRARP